MNFLFKLQRRIKYEKFKKKNKKTRWQTRMWLDARNKPRKKNEMELWLQWNWLDRKTQKMLEQQTKQKKTIKKMGGYQYEFTAWALIPNDVNSERTSLKNQQRTK